MLTFSYGDESHKLSSSQKKKKTVWVCVWVGEGVVGGVGWGGEEREEGYKKVLTEWVMV